MTTFRVAIADDHAVVRSGYRRLLELEDGMEVVAEFGDGEDAYRWLCERPADLLILDLSMPGRGGLDTLQRLRHRVPSLRVLVFTMHDSPALAAQALRLGASGYVTKSSPPQSLIEAVRSVAAGGCPLSDEVAQARQPGPQHEGLPHWQLSPREFDMFLLFAEGASVEEIAANRFLSAKTVANYQTTIRQKTGCANALAMYHYAQQHALLGAAPAAASRRAAAPSAALRSPRAASPLIADGRGSLR